MFVMFLKWVGFEYLVWAQNFRVLGPEIKTVAESRAASCGSFGTAALMWLGAWNRNLAGSGRRLPIECRSDATVHPRFPSRAASLISEIKVA
jgi:hypothetical protein